jgi:hypothetical protein
MDFRQYDPALGRFNSMDVLSEIFFETSPYAFTLNNPVFFSDPTGLCPECPDNAKMNDTYVSDGGATYIFGEGGWIRQDGELDEVVVTGDAPTSTTEQVADVVTDFIPFVGSGKDIYNGFKNDDPLLIAMGVGFFVVDIFTLGSGSIVKGAVKTAGKQIAKEASEQTAKRLLITAGKKTLHKHHIMPQQFRKWFAERGISNIDDFTVPISSKTHGTLHGKAGRWNQRWSEFINENPAATPSEIFYHAESLLKEFGLQHLPYVKY